MDPHHSKKVRGIMAHRRTCSAWQKHPRGVQLRLDHGGGFDLRWLIPRSVVWSKLERRGEGWVDQTPRGLVDPPFSSRGPAGRRLRTPSGQAVLLLQLLTGGRGLERGVDPPQPIGPRPKIKGEGCVWRTHKNPQKPPNRDLDQNCVKSQKSTFLPLKTLLKLKKRFFNSKKR